MNLSVRCIDSKTASSLAKVLTPDNRGFSKELTFVMRRKGPTLSFEVQARSVSQCISTIESVLSDVKLFQEVWVLSS
jgi:hypothetical protein